jgi:hypothetical protein
MSSPLASSVPMALFGLAITAGCQSQMKTTEEGQLTWRNVEHESVTALDANGHLMFELRYGPTEDEPAIHPVGLPGAAALTRDRPSDHPWHHGLWFAWKYIDGINYWEHGPDGRPVGRTTWGEPKFDIYPDGSARVSLELSYGHAEPRTPLSESGTEPDARLRESRELTIHPPANDGTWAMDWESSFRAVSAAVTLDRTPMLGEPDGVFYGGYAGLSLRLVQLIDRQVTTIEGTVPFSSNSRAQPHGNALDYSGRTSEGAPLVGIAVFEHPDNLRCPRSWYAIRSDTMTFFTPAVLAEGPLIVEPKKDLQLAWRIVVHPGSWTPARISSERSQYLTSLVP